MRQWIDKLFDRLLPGIAAVLVCFVMAFALKQCSAEADEPSDDWTDAQWKAYSDQAQKGECGAGHPTFPTGKPPKSWKDDKFKTPKEGIDIGFSWPKKPNKFLDRLEARDALYGPWCQKYRGGLSRGQCLVKSAIEAIKPIGSCTWDKNHWECGVMGLKKGAARSCGCNACDPECNIACAMRLMNVNRIQAHKDFPDLALAPELDQYLIAGLYTSPGAGYAKAIISKSGMLKTVDSGGGAVLVHDKPYFYGAEWMKKYTSKVLAKLMAPFKAKVTWHRVAIRYAIELGYLRAAMAFHGVYNFSDLPRGKKYVVIKIPKHLPPYPGDDKHGKCYPEFADMTRKRP